MLRFARLARVRARAQFASAATPDARLVLSTIDVNGVATITLNAPHTLNAMTVTMGEQFAATVEQLKHNAAVKAVVLTGAGRAFSAGGDLQFLLARSQTPPIENSQIMRNFYARFLSIRQLSVPLIAAIHGPAIGAGLCVACACDLRIAAASAKMGFTFATLALHPGMAATHFLPRLVGAETAARLLLTGEVFTGTRARELGLVGDVCAAEADVLPRALQLATQIAANSTPVVRSTTRSLRMAQEADFERTLQREADAQAICYASPEFAARLQQMLADKDKAAAAKKA